MLFGPMQEWKEYTTFAARFILTLCIYAFYHKTEAIVAQSNQWSLNLHRHVGSFRSFRLNQYYSSFFSFLIFLIEFGYCKSNQKGLNGLAQRAVCQTELNRRLGVKESVMKWNLDIGLNPMKTTCSLHIQHCLINEKVVSKFKYIKENLSRQWTSFLSWQHMKHSKYSWISYAADFGFCFCQLRI